MTPISRPARGYEERSGSARQFERPNAGTRYVPGQLPSGRREDDAVVVDDYDRKPAPREFQGREPFGNRKTMDSQKQTSSMQRRVSKNSPSRSLSRKSKDNEMISQKKAIRNGATITRTITGAIPSKHQSIKKIQEVDADMMMDDAMSFDEVEGTSMYEFKNSKAGSCTSYASWDNKSFASFYSEHTIAITRKEIINDTQDLINLDEETMSYIRDRSRSRDFRGQKVKTLSGLEAPMNVPIRAVVSDSESDIEADFGKIESNIQDHKMYHLNLRQKYAVYNAPEQKIINKIFKTANEKDKQRKLKGREIKKVRRESLERDNTLSKRKFKEDINKENLINRENFVGP